MKAMPCAEVLYNDGKDIEKARELAQAADAVVIVAGYIHCDEGEYLSDRADIAEGEMGGDRVQHASAQQRCGFDTWLKDVNPNTVVSIIGSSAIPYR